MGVALAWDDVVAKDQHVSGEDTHLVSSIGGRGSGGQLPRVRVDAPDPTLTDNAGMVAVAELIERLGVIEALDAAIGAIKQRDRGFGAGELLVGLASAQLAGEAFFVGLDRLRADAAGQQLVGRTAGLASTTAHGLARRISGDQWLAVESGRSWLEVDMNALQ